MVMAHEHIAWRPIALTRDAIWVVRRSSHVAASVLGAPQFFQTKFELFRSAG